MLNLKNYIAKVHFLIQLFSKFVCFKMVSEGGRGSFLDACYQSKEIPFEPALLICRPDPLTFFCVSSDI